MIQTNNVITLLKIIGREGGIVMIFLKNRGNHIVGVSMEGGGESGGFKHSAHYEIFVYYLFAKTDLGPYETTDVVLFEGIVNGVELLRLQKPEFQMLDKVLNTPLISS